MMENIQGFRKSHAVGRITAALCSSLLLAILVSLVLPAVSLAGNNVWTTNGPNYNGNVYAIAVSPSYTSDGTIFAGVLNGSGNGGVYRTTDSWTTWSQVNTGLPAGADIFALAISPTYDNAGTNGTAQKTIFAGAGQVDGVYLSTDGGASWSQATSGIPSTSFVWSLAISPNFNGTTDRTVIAGTTSGIYRSTDAGTNWTQVSSGGDIRALAAAPDGNTMFAANGLYGVYKSTDAGASWNSVGSDPPSSSLVQSLAISPNYASDQTVFAGTQNNGVYKSINGGATWSQLNSGPANTNVRALAISPNYATDQTVLADGGGSDSNVLRSVNGGTNWNQVGAVYLDGSPNSYSLAFSPGYASDATIFTGEDQRVYSFTFGADVTPPTTTLATNPVNPDGQFGYFDTTPTVTLTSNEPGTTYYQWDSTGAGGWNTYSGSFNALGGQHTLYYYSVDTAGNAETVKSQLFKVNSDSERVVFASDRDNLGTGANGREIYTMNPDGTGVVRVTNNTLEDNHPSFSKDGSKITFYSGLFSGSQQSDIYTMNVDGTGLTQVTSNPTALNEDPTFSPDAARIAYQADDGAAVRQIHVINSDGTGDVQVTSGSVLSRDPIFAPSGNNILYDYGDSAQPTGADLYSMVDDGTVKTQLTSMAGDERWPRYSDDGTKIVFSNGSGTIYDIYTADADGSNITRLTNNGAYNRHPDFSPDGTRVIFTSNAPGNWELYSMDSANGANLTRLSTNTALDIRPVWWGPASGTPADTTAPSTTLVTNPASPNAANGWFSTAPSITLTSNEPGTTYYQWASTGAGGWTTYSGAFSASAGIKTLYYYSVDSAGNNEPVKSRIFRVGNPGPGKIVFYSNRTGNEDIFVMNEDGTNQTQLTSDPATDSVPAFSPDGSKIAFTSNRTGDDEIYIMNSDGSGQTNISNNSARDRRPQFSPDGSKIAFHSNRDGGSNQIYVMDAVGTNPVRITNDSGGANRPVFSPDRSKIVFHSGRDGNREIYVMDADGSNQTRLTNDAGGDQGPYFTRDGTKILWHTDREGNFEIYQMNVDGSSPVNLSNNAGWDERPAMSSAADKIGFTSFRSGNFEVWAMNPDGSSPVNLTNNAAADQAPDWAPGTVSAPAGDTTPPNTTLTTIPGAPDGDNSWFKTIPTITLLSDEPGITYYQWGSTSGAWTPYSAALTGSEGRNTLYYYSDDIAVNSETVKSRLIKVDTSAPTVPLLAGTPISSARIDLSWPAAADAVSTVYGYRVYNASNGTLLAQTSSLSASITGLSANTGYSYYIKAEDKAGNLSGQSNTVNVTTPASGPDTTPPSAPSLQGFTPSTNDRVDLSWPVPADDVGVTGYKIYNAATGVELADIAATGYAFTGLTSGSTYSYYVKAYDAAGNLSAASNTVAMTLGAGGTTSAGASVGEVTINPTPNVTMTFSDITGSGVTSVTEQTSPVAAPPDTFKFSGNQLEIATTASFTPPIRIAVQYDPATLTRPEEYLKLFHYEAGAWQDVTLYVDTANNVIVGEVNSLSPFILGEPEGGEPSTGRNTAMPFAVGLLVIGLGLVVLLRGSRLFFERR